MINDDKILNKMKEIQQKASEYINYVHGFNPCAYSDRMVESVIKAADELKKLYESQIPDASKISKKN